MNSLIDLKTAILPPLIVFVLVFTCIGVSPKALAVVPPPDGGYPGANTAEGQSALLSLTTGIYNTAVGTYSLLSLTDGDFNTAVGAGALLANISGSNTAMGAGALLSTTTGGNNTANGALALFSNTIGHSNTATGAGALLSNTEGYNNTANGFHALFTNSIGNANTAIGESTLFINGAGGQNTAVGSGALQNNTIGNGNTALGIAAGSAVTTASGIICIGTPGANIGNSCFIGHVWNEPGGTQAVYVNSEGKLGQMVSSRRFKDQIKPIDKSSEAIYALKPVSFRYKAEIEPTRVRGYGLIAEDVEKVSPDLVTRGADGQVQSVRYDLVNAMLLNEFLKEHKKDEQQGRKIEELEATIARLEALLKKQAAQIQKVSVCLQTHKAAPRVAANSR